MAEICFSLTANKIKLEHWAKAEEKAKGYMLCQSESPEFLAYTEKVTIGEPVLRIGGFDILKSQYEALRSFARANDLPAAKVLKSISAQNGQVVWLHLEGIKVRDISALSRLSGLKGLNLNGSQVADLSPLAGLKSLQKLELRGTPVSDISPLGGLKQLLILDLTRTKVKDISALKNLTEIQEILLAFTDISDIKPLLNKRKLSFVNLRGTKVPYQQVEKLRQANPKAEIWAASAFQPVKGAPATVAGLNNKQN